jgi:hemerythrin-like domain-containing protein
MVHYLDAYAEQRHHPREDPLFIRLAAAARKPPMPWPGSVSSTPRRRRGSPCCSRRWTYVADPARFEAFAKAFEDYAEFYRNHIMLEESAVLPLLRTHLDAADWAAAEAEFQADMASRDLAAHEDFAGLFSKLVACAPAPIGFGPRPFTD